MFIYKIKNVTHRIILGIITAILLFSPSLQHSEARAEVTPEKLQTLLDRQEITQLLYRNARSIDRLDVDLMKSTYWPDAIQDHQDPIYPIDYSGNAWEFSDFAISELAKITRTNHRITNVTIELNGDRAYAEAYVRAYHIVDLGDAKKEGILLGRYQNILERRNGEWKILYRLTIFDANQNLDATEVWSDTFRNMGARYPEDFSYNVIKKVTGTSKLADSLYTLRALERARHGRLHEKPAQRESVPQGVRGEIARDGIKSQNLQRPHP